MKYNLIYFDANQLEDYFFNQDYRNAYDEILSSQTFIWTGGTYNSTFKVLVRSFNNEFNLANIHKSKINKIWVRGKNFDYEKYKDFDVINTQLVENIADDKNKTYEYLKDLMPKQFNFVSDIDERWFFNNKVVTKPVNELKGKNINVTDSLIELSTECKRLQNIYGKKGYLIQEFIECVDYEPLGIKGVHDIRLIIVNSKIVGLAVRQPKEGGWLCNVAQGGSIKVYDRDELLQIYHDDSKNKSFKHLVDLKESVLDKLPKDFKSAIFSIDFCNTKDGFKIFELNSYPGIRLEYKTYIKKVKELLN